MRAVALANVAAQGCGGPPAPRRHPGVGEHALGFPSWPAPPPSAAAHLTVGPYHPPPPPRCREALLKEPSLVEVTSSADVVVVGDLHGQFGDLRRIFAELGRPSNAAGAKVWVFLGDYIDRGPNGLEIVATLFALKLLYPANIHLLRGNHECSEITVRAT